MHQANYIIFLLLYVDDIIFTGSSTSKICELNAALAARFSLKDMQPLTYFLSIKVCHTPIGILLSQQKYIANLLHRFNMLDAKGVKIPLVAFQSLQLDNGTAPSDPK